MLEQARQEGFSSTFHAADETGHGPVLETQLAEADNIPTADADSLSVIAHRGPVSVAGEHVGRFELLRELGRGGYGVVYLARDPQVGRHVALKIPRPEVLVSFETRRRFLREAQAAGALEHANLVPVYEVGEDGPFCYLASADCAGPNLAQWLKECTAPVPVRRARIG